MGNMLSEIRWDKLLKTYDIKVLSRNGRVMFFLLGDRRYYYGIPSGQIRRKGESNWTKDVLKMLNKDFNNSIPPKGSTEKGIPPSIVNFGKYIGWKWKDVISTDPNYIKWLLLNTKNDELKAFLEEETKDIVQELNQKKAYSEEEVREITLSFFFYWYNAEGTNTVQGFDDWFTEFKNKENEITD
jgi:hypothetical protein